MSKRKGKTQPDQAYLTDPKTGERVMVKPRVHELVIRSYQNLIDKLGVINETVAEEEYTGETRNIKVNAKFTREGFIDSTNKPLHEQVTFKGLEDIPEEVKRQIVNETIMAYNNAMAEKQACIEALTEKILGNKAA